METKKSLEQPLFTDNLFNSNSQGKQGLQNTSENVSEDNLLEQNSISQILDSRAEFDSKENSLNAFNLSNNLENKQNSSESLKTKNNGSNNLGKFKDSDSLLNSYNLLQSDYTKKCQALKELQKKVEEENFLKLEEENKKQELLSRGEKFFENNPRAKKYENQIKELVLKDKELQRANTPFESAWAKFMGNNFFSADELAKDENFLKNYIFNNEQIKSQIINNYFSSLKINNSPILISNQVGSKTVLTPISKPKSIGEAGKLAEEMFLN